MLTDPYARTSCGRKAECAVYLFLIVAEEIKRCLWYRIYGLISSSSLKISKLCHIL
jgi:hypothetical protein